MSRIGKIVTVGLSPSWDITCKGANLQWGGHTVVEETFCRPAGKALNISRCLCWMGQGSVAAGLWGRDSYGQMARAIRGLKKIKLAQTQVAGETRRNINIVDTARNREMHLRAVSGLVSKAAIRKLKSDLAKVVTKDSVCVFSGALPSGAILSDIATVIKFCQDRKAKVAVDTSSAGLKRIVCAGGVWFIKPNVGELGELLGEKIADRTASLVKAGRKLLGKVEIVLISRGSKGAVVVTRKSAWEGRCEGKGQVLSTVGCGDYMVGGFLQGMKASGDIAEALACGLRAGTAKAWGLEEKKWVAARRKVKVKIKSV